MIFGKGFPNTQKKKFANFNLVIHLVQQTIYYRKKVFDSGDGTFNSKGHFKDLLYKFLYKVRINLTFNDFKLKFAGEDGIIEIMPGFRFKVVDF